MVRRNQIVLLLICLFTIAALLSLNAATRRPSPIVDKYCDVGMTKAGRPGVSVDPMVLRAKRDRAVWRATSKIEIRFADGVDTPKCTESRGGRWQCVSKVFTEPGKHKYSVVMTDSAGKEAVLDPEIDIRPCAPDCP